MAEGARPPLRPTVMAPPPRRAPETKSVAAPAPAAPRRAAPTPTPPAPAPLGPTAIAGGVERQRIPAAAADLSRIDPGADPATVAAALRLVAGFVPEKASERRAVLWGHDIQADYARRMAEALALAGAPALDRARAHVARMIEILASLDLEAAAAREGGLLGGALRAVGGRADTAAEIEAARGELDHLACLMADGMDELLALRGRIEANAAALDALSRDADAASLAASFLAGHLRARQPGVADRLDERAMSLKQMVLQLGEHRGLRESQLDQPLRLIGTMQHVALVALPGLLGALAAFGPRAGRRPTPTEAGETARRAREIVQHLNA